MITIVLNFLKAKGVSQNLLNKISPLLAKAENLDQVKNILTKYQDKLPNGLIDQLDSLNLNKSGNINGKAAGILGAVKKIFGKK